MRPTRALLAAACLAASTILSIPSAGAGAIALAVPASSGVSASPLDAVRVPTLNIASITRDSGGIEIRGTINLKKARPLISIELIDLGGASSWTDQTYADPHGDWTAWIDTSSAAALSADTYVIVTGTSRRGHRQLQTETEVPADALAPAAPTGPAPELPADYAPAGEIDPDAAPAGSPTSYRFLVTGGNGQPVHWDHCTPIAYFVNPEGMPAGGSETISEAFVRLAAATGQSFVSGGSTTAIPYVTTSDMPDDRGPGIYIGFAAEERTPLLEGNIVGRGGFSYRGQPAGGDGIIDHGGIVIETRDWTPGFHTGAGLGGVLMHELGHVFNLDHVDDGSQLMYPMRGYGEPTTFQAGDLAGLAGLASRGCASA